MKVRIASVCFCLAVVITTAPGTGFAQTLTTIHSFSGPTSFDGQSPNESSVTLHNGLLFGLTFYLGSADHGSVFTLTP